jgi:prephenate dehydratase
MTASMTRKIAFQGEPGAFSHAAAHALFPADEALPCTTFEDTIAAVQQGRADFGVVPVENSLYGRITDIYHLLPESGLFITAEHFLRVEMNLLAVPGATLADIVAVQSLSVALGQCRKFISRHKFKTINAVDTAGSAREVAEKGDKSVAAIASRFAAEVYGLSILATNIEDASHNTTRFLVVARQPVEPAAEVEKVKTTFVFRVRNVPAALYKAMGGFATNGELHARRLVHRHAVLRRYRRAAVGPRRGTGVRGTGLFHRPVQGAGRLSRRGSERGDLRFNRSRRPRRHRW